MPAPTRAHALLRPHSDRFDASAPGAAATLAAHADAVAAGRPLYRDPASGLWVMTAAELIRRGWCCENGCRHCPYVGA
ncbi:MAG: DUF5522 domain-containing protein [Acidimicrobiales bacterium]